MNIFTIFFLIVIIYNIVKNKRALHMLQQNLYNDNSRYLRWVAKNPWQVFINLDLIALVILVIAYFSNSEFRYWLIVIAIIFYILDALRIIAYAKAEKIKKPLVVTKRIKRLVVTSSLIFMVPIAVYILDNDVDYLAVLVLATLTFLSYIVVLVAKVFNTPIEACVYRYYEVKAKRKLKSMTNLKVVGITGSYGKTSSKNILSDILNLKYIARPSPKNLNTEYGLMITINNHLDKFDDIFIAEMGAHARGDIKKLCELVPPKYGILTTIGLAHLDTMGTPEIIRKTKFELIESLPPDGVGVLNGDDPKQTSYNIKSKCKKIWIGLENEAVDIRAINIKCSHKGSTFDIIFKGDEKKYPFETRLLGNHNIYNILAAVALGKEFGMSISELQKGVLKAKPTESRLELRNYGYMYQINDAYNSNPVGAKMAVEVLDMMPGTKVVVTPGMIELAEKEAELNEIFGNQIGKVADYVILVGEKRTKPIFKGIMEQGFKKENIYVVNSVYEAYNILQGLKVKGDLYALFENDLPDSLNE